MTRLRAEYSAWCVGAAGLLGSVSGWILLPAQFPHSWLAALTCWIGWPLGSIALVLIHALTGGRWGMTIRGSLAAGIATLPLVIAAVLPLLFVLHSLYPWMQSAVALRLDNRFYLNAPFFYSRGIVYLIVWLGLGLLVLRALRREDPQPMLNRIAPFGLILLALTVTFSATDYTLSMDPHFKSSIYGLLVGSEAVLLALSVAMLATTLTKRTHCAESAHGAESTDGAEGTHDAGSSADLGRLLFALLVLWAYLDFMQWLIVWNSDLPEEAAWYVRRFMGEWALVAVLIAALHFVVPFFALIWPQVQRSRLATAALATLLVVMEVPRAWWLVIPAGGRNLSWVDVAAMMAVLGMAAGMALRAARSGPRAADSSEPGASHG